jgi:hypothetical protein
MLLCRNHLHSHLAPDLFLCAQPQKPRLWICLLGPFKPVCLKFFLFTKTSLWLFSQSLRRWLEVRTVHQRVLSWSMYSGQGTCFKGNEVGERQASVGTRKEMSLLWLADLACMCIMKRSQFEHMCNSRLLCQEGRARFISLQGPHKRCESFQVWEPKPWGFMGHDRWPTPCKPQNHSLLLRLLHCLGPFSAAWFPGLLQGLWLQGWLEDLRANVFCFQDLESNCGSNVPLINKCWPDFIDFKSLSYLSSFKASRLLSP